MTKTEFSEAVEIMVKALPTQGVEKRVAALYEFYQDAPIRQVQLAAKDAAQNVDRFPTPRAFGEILSKFKNKKGAKNERQACSVCDGYGMVQIGLEMYVGRCEHGSRFPSFKKAPTDTNEVIVILRSQERTHDAFYGSGSWKERTHSLREKAKMKCLPRGTWI